MREDFIRERAEYRDSLAGMREATQALDKDRRQLARNETACRPSWRRFVRPSGREAPADVQAGRPRGESKRARFLASPRRWRGPTRGIDPAKVSPDRPATSRPRSVSTGVPPAVRPAAARPRRPGGVVMTPDPHLWRAILIALFALAAFARFPWWAFIPLRQLPGNRVSTPNPCPAAAAPGPRARDRL